MGTEPSPATLGALRATREARRLAAAVARGRAAALDTVTCARCGRTIAVATDADHPARAFEGRVMCGPCIKSRRCFERERRDRRLRPPAVSIPDIDEWVRAGWAVVLPREPDPRPTFGEWLRSLFGRRRT